MNLAFTTRAYPVLHKAAEDLVSPCELPFEKEAAGSLPLLTRLRGLFSPRAITEAYRPGYQEVASRTGQKWQDLVNSLEQQLSAARTELGGLRGSSDQVKNLEAQLLKVKGAGPGLSWPAKAAIGAGVVGVPAAYLGGHHLGAEEGGQGKLMALGGGTAIGLFAPRILRALTENVNRLGATPQYSQGY